MDNNTLWSLRLGFSSKQAGLIQKEGIVDFVKSSFAAPIALAPSSLMKGELRTAEEIKTYRNKRAKEQGGSLAVQLQMDKKLYDIRAWWIEVMIQENYPLREKLTLFWHNHYVCTLKKIRVNYWLYDHNMILRNNAFGNFRELTKKMLYSNAIVKYLDNNDNINNKFNENLSRELLELFTLGIGNYTEKDIKEGAKALAGLTLGPDGAVYDEKYEYKGTVEYFGQKGNFKANDIVDIIFKQKQAPYFITKKLLKWFVYDNPPEKLITYYGNYLRKVDYEIQPLLLKIFKEEFAKSTAGSKIKDPLVYMLQLNHELNITNQNKKIIALFLRDQGMDFYNQLNVKGWEGGRAWISAQIMMMRNSTADMLCKGQTLKRIRLKHLEDENEIYTESLDINLDWSKKGNNIEVIKEFTDRLLFLVDENLQAELEQIVTHDFKPDKEGSDSSVMRLFNKIVKTPEFQVI